MHTFAIAFGVTSALFIYTAVNVYIGDRAGILACGRRPDEQRGQHIEASSAERVRDRGARLRRQDDGQPDTIRRIGEHFGFGK